MLPKVVDLFSGCGGLALGFEKAGFDICGGIELMPEAVQTITYNLNYRYGEQQTHICGDITETEADCFSDRIGKEGCIVIGGPPCQAYSIAGKAKLRSLGEDRINTKDARGFLYQDFLRFVYDLDATFVIMENVPEAVNFGELNIPETVCKSLTEHGYNARWTILNAADFGVPQCRERLFVFASKKKCGKEIPLPVPTHKSDSSHRTNMQKRLESFKQYEFFSRPISSDNAEKSWVTVGDAFSDLPVLFPNAKAKYRSVKLNEELNYAKDTQNEFQDIMRNWYGKKCSSVSANAFRNTKRDYPIFEKMKQGDDYVAASNIADALFEEEARVYGYKPDTLEYEHLKKKMVPVYDRGKFERRWQKLAENKPAHTLVAHLAKDTYSHIHPTEPRGISVREAARIQSFPDDFYFSCSMGDAFKQIGNAVPPLLAYAVANSVRSACGEEV